MYMSKFREMQDIGRYLGVPLNGKPLKREDYMYVLNQIENKITCWKAKQLSLTG